MTSPLSGDAHSYTVDTHMNYSPKLFAPDSRPYGHTYGEWTGKWWQWAVSIPKNQSPLIDTTGKNCAEKQTGPVWFLAGTILHKHFAKRRCTIPAGKAILFPILVSEFSYSEVPYIKTEDKLISYVQKDISEWILLEASIDGVELTELDKYRIQYGPFNLLLPKDNVWNVKDGITQAASDGFWAFLAPMSKGNHTISFHGVEPNFETGVTYVITIKS